MPAKLGAPHWPVTTSQRQWSVRAFNVFAMDGHSSAVAAAMLLKGGDPSVKLILEMELGPYVRTIKSE